MELALIGLTMGVTAGMNPGPLGVYIIHQTMAKGPRHGLLASLAPWLTDGFMILLALLMTVNLKEVDWFISAISIAGAIYLAYLAYKMLKVKGDVDPSAGKSSGSSLLTAMKVNLLNPLPYIFWFTIGAGYISKGTGAEPLLFVFGTLFGLSSTKFVVALAIKFLGDRFSPKVYAAILRALGLPLIFFSGQLFYDGIKIWF